MAFLRYLPWAAALWPSLAAAAPPAIPTPAPQPPAAPSLPPSLVVAYAPGAPKDAIRKALLQSFGAVARLPVLDAKWDGADVAALGSLGADLVAVPAPLAEAGCRSKAFARTDWARLGRDRFVAAATADCGVGLFIATSALAWDKDKIAVAPNWSDFWDVARRPGRRGMPRQAEGTLEVALLADGVPLADIYRTLRTAEGVDRAFRKLDQLKPYIAWWDKAEQPAQWLLSGNVLMTVGLASAVQEAGRAAKRHFGVQWAQSLVQPWLWAIPAAAPHAGQAALALLMATDIGRQVALAQATGLGPAVADAQALLSSQETAASPALPANLAAGLVADAGFWAEQGGKLQQRFLDWAAK